MNIYREIISKDLDISNISDVELARILDDIGRGVIYEYLLFGNGFTYEDFIEVMKIYLGLLENIDKM